MPHLNKVMIIGNLTADPELRQTIKGTAVTELRLAINRKTGGQDGTERREETTFLDVTCWNRLAEIAASYLSKGRPVFIEGCLQMDSWDDKTTGQKRTRIRIIAENLQLLAGDRQERQERDTSSYTPSTQRSSYKPTSPTSTTEHDEDIPF